MDLILTHMNADFDAAASMVAASKLYPNAHLGLSGSLNRNVREFFGFYLRRIRLLRAREVDPRRVRRLIIVDTQEPSRLGRFASLATRPEVEKILFDHHLRPAGTFHPPARRTVRPLGATITLLVNLLLKRRVPISPIEATLFMTGIYEDTGCLLFHSTTPADIRAVLDLTRLGGDLSIVAGFVERGLDSAQRAVLEELMASLRLVRLHGFDIGVATATSRGYLEDLDAVVGKLRQIMDLGVLFVAVGMGRHTYVIGRSRYAEVHVGEVLGLLGGGGHPYAASAVLHGVAVQSATSRLLAALESKISPQATARQIMSSPVKTVSAQISTVEARNVMSGFGYGSLPVMDGSRLVGIVSRVDMEKAVHHGLGHARVTGYMTRDPYVVAPDTPVLDVQHLMIEHNVSAAPVVEDGRLIGIVTAQDLLRFLHRAGRREGRKPRGDAPAIPRNCLDRMQRALTPDRLRLVTAAGETGDELGLRSWLVGGTVRDILLGRPSSDVDVVVEQDAHLLARTIHERKGGRIQLYDRYRTATLTIGGMRLDLATTRREFYEFPAAPPQVDTQNVRLDLFRRDFTINAMALGLSRGELGDLFDYYGGYRDLLDKRIRVLHNLSFVEDPTRILRAMKFAGRLEFELEPGTSSLVDEALAAGMLDKLGREVVFGELSSCLKEAAAARVVRCMASKGVLRALSPRLDPSPEVLELVFRADSLIHRFEASGATLKDRSYPYFAILFLADPVKREVAIARFLVPRKYQEWATQIEADRAFVVAAGQEELVSRMRAQYPPPRMLGILAHLDPDIAQRVLVACVEGSARQG